METRTSLESDDESASDSSSERSVRSLFHPLMYIVLVESGLGSQLGGGLRPGVGEWLFNRRLLSERGGLLVDIVSSSPVIIGSGDRVNLGEGTASDSGAESESVNCLITASSSISLLSVSKDTDEEGDGRGQAGGFPWSSLLSTHSRFPPTSSAQDTLFLLFFTNNLSESLSLFVCRILQVFTRHRKQRGEAASGCNRSPHP